MTCLSRLRAALRPAAGPTPTPRARALCLIAGLVAIGLLLLLVHVAASSPLDHADCPVCKTLQHALVVIAPTTALGITLSAILRVALPATLPRRAPCRYRGRAPPFPVFA